MNAADASAKVSSIWCTTRNDVAAAARVAGMAGAKKITVCTARMPVGVASGL